MRLIIAVAVAFVAVCGAGAIDSGVAGIDAAYTVAAQQPELPGNIDVDIEAGTESGAWWTSPLWIAIGVIGLLLIVVLVALAARGGGTTVIKE